MSLLARHSYASTEDRRFRHPTGTLATVEYRRKLAANFSKTTWIRKPRAL